MKKNFINKLIKSQNLIIISIVILLISFITIGFAQYKELLEFNGNVEFIPDGKIEIKKITQVSTSNVVSSETPVFTEDTVTFNVEFGKDDSESDEFYVIYSVEIVNGSSYDYTYIDFKFEPTITASGDGTGELSLIVDGISGGDIIKSGETRIVTMKLELIPSDTSQNYETSGSTTISLEQQVKGTILAAVTPTTVDLTGDIELAELKLEVINTYSFDVNFELQSNNSNFTVVDELGNELETFTINANSTNEYTVYLKISTGSIFNETTETTALLLKCNSIGNIYSDNITISVDKSEEIDTIPPEIGEITFAINNTVGSADLTWTRLDSEGTSVSYTIIVYKSDGTKYGDNITTDYLNYTLTNLEEGSYYVVIYGIDKAGNSGLDMTTLNECSTTNTYCRKSETIDLKWVFSVTTNLTSNLSTTGADTVNIGTTYSATISSSFIFFYALPETINVSMGKTTLTSSEYTWNSSTGALTIENVTGDLIITIEEVESCLVEGTKIKLANGTTKNIEDINYNDLLLVWSYEEGRFVYEYPIWIEKKGKTNKYQLTKFSDGTELKTVGYHGVYNMDLNMFVSVDDPNNFHVGSNIATLNSNGDGFVKTKVTNIEIIEKPVEYYHVVSTRYYNIIANDLLTTDGTVILSNLYGFNNNIEWPSIRDTIMKNKENLYDYKEFSDIIPYYMFKGLRAEEGKYLNNIGYLPKSIFKEYLTNNQMNPKMLLEPQKNINGERLWMVTTSNDKLNNLNIKENLVIEGTYYKLDYPKENPSKFMYWYDMSSGKKYYAGDFVQIWHGSHFEAVYKNN